MLATIHLALALSFSYQEITDDNGVRNHLKGTFNTIDSPGAELVLWHDMEAMQVSKVSPKHKWEFPFVTSGFVKTAESEQASLRLRVFSQYRKANHDDIAQWSTRMLLRLYGYNLFRLGRENPEAYGKIVDVYLSFGGPAGGEQLFDLDPGDLDSGNRPRKANTVYIYQVAEISDPFQLCRELAHEFGHATLPGVGPFEGPEDWANGDVGERIYLNWILADIKANSLATEDAVNASIPALENYVKTRVQPGITKIATYGPNHDLLKLKTKEAYEEYVSLAAYGAMVLPGKQFNKALNLAGADPSLLAKSLVEVAKEVKDFELRLPEYLKNKAVYLPYNKSALKKMNPLQIKSDFTKIQTTSAAILISN